MYKKYLLNISLKLILISGFIYPHQSYSQNKDSLSSSQIEAANNAGTKTRGEVSHWRSDSLKIIYSFDERWEKHNPANRDTISVIGWRIKSSGALMATCYLEASSTSKFSIIPPDKISENLDELASSLIRATRKRDPNMQLISSKKTMQDNHPVVFVIRDVNYETIQTKFTSRIYSVYTVWNGNEINFECGSSIPHKFPQLTKSVEAPIMAVLSSLIFIR